MKIYPNKSYQSQKQGIQTEATKIQAILQITHSIPIPSLFLPFFSNINVKF